MDVDIKDEVDASARRAVIDMEPLPNDDETTDAIGELTSAAKARWSGQLFFSDAGNVKGSVSFARGRVAWAVSAQHKEDLGTFLWRLGRVTDQQIAEIRRQYEKHHGERKIGSLLEEAGVIQRAALRRCLLLHTRMVLTSLMSCGELEGTWRDDVAFNVDETMTFELEEVMPELLAPEQADVNTSSAEHQWHRWQRRNKMLAGLDQVGGYLGAAVVSSDGDLVAADGPKRAFNPSTLGFFVASALDSISRVTPVALGAVEVIHITCESGLVVTRWVDSRKSHLVLLLLDATGKLEGATHVLNAATPSIARVIDRWSLHHDLRTPLPSDIDDLGL